MTYIIYVVAALPSSRTCPLERIEVERISEHSSSYRIPNQLLKISVPPYSFLGALSFVLNKMRAHYEKPRWFIISPTSALRKRKRCLPIMFVRRHRYIHEMLSHRSQSGSVTSSLSLKRRFRQHASACCSHSACSLDLSYLLTPPLTFQLTSGERRLPCAQNGYQRYLHS